MRPLLPLLPITNGEVIALPSVPRTFVENSGLAALTELKMMSSPPLLSRIRRLPFADKTADTPVFAVSLLMARTKGSILLGVMVAAIVIGSAFNDSISNLTSPAAEKDDNSTRRLLSARIPFSDRASFNFAAAALAEIPAVMLISLRSPFAITTVKSWLRTVFAGTVMLPPIATAALPLLPRFIA